MMTPLLQSTGKPKDTLGDTFLQQAGLSITDAVPLPADGSDRRYFRLQNRTGTVLFMDSSQDKDACLRFHNIGIFLIEAGFSAPKVFEADIENGYLLVEDFGKEILSKSTNRQDKRIKFLAASDVARELGRITVPNYMGLNNMDNEKLVSDANLFINWYPNIFNSKDSVSLKAQYSDIFRCIFSGYNHDGKLTLGDFHSGNLMWLDGKQGAARVGLLDYQDAVLCNRYYDMICLLNDVRTYVSRALHREMIKMFNFPGSELEEVYPILSAQRALRTIGIISRLVRRDGKHHFASQVDVLWKYLEETLKSDSLIELNRWLEAHVPREMRTSRIFR